RPPSIELAAGARDEIVDAFVAGVLKVVLMAREHDAYARAREERQQRLHPIGVVMIRACAKRGMVAEHDFPACRGVRRERLIDPFPVLRIFEQASTLEEILLGRVDADEID